MATIDIRRPHNVGRDVAKQKAEELAKSLEEKIGIRWSWERDTIKFDVPSGAAKGASGTVDVDASAVRVQIDLPFLLRAVKGTIESKVNKKLDDLLG
ncbi:MAG TPA: polyhydroxyalkanoic acid system family protein [Polyangiaceae bacterium]|jgi:putative polyhydroxyalkanoate system protein|nr:polyhydroxyalkanoic acid system family protein [Polyangiaceae bacterium]